LALICDEETTVRSLEESIKGAAGKILEDAAFFDMYKGAPIPAGKKSVAFLSAFPAGG
jgi:phenylalanyl-tRNA synthetase beta chain